MVTFIGARLRRWALWLLSAGILAGCATGVPPAASSVTGTATYRERIALPPQAVFEAAIEDVSRADAASVVIGSTRIESPRVPISFSIAYDPARIEAERRYVVRARITLDGRLFFTTDTAYPVLGPGGASHVDMLLRRAGGSAPPPAESGVTASLENTYWKLISLRGQPVVVVQNQREPHFVLHAALKRMAGSGGCNHLTGEYTLDGDRLSFGRTAGTLMACPQGMEQERAFLDTLTSVARWRIEGQRLELLDAGGAALAHFEAKYLQ